MMLDAPNCGPGGNQMTFSSLNIHYHGTNTSPTCHSDEVIKTLINSGQTFQYNVAFPTNEPPGLYWYHPHVHGIAEKAVLGGASGALVVEGIEDVQPAVSDLRQRILVIRDQPTVQFLQQRPDGKRRRNPDGIPFQDLTVNNITTNTMTDTTQNPPVTTYTPPFSTWKLERKQFWRVCQLHRGHHSRLASAIRWRAADHKSVAIDGVPVNSQDATEPGRLIPVNHFRLPPASRVEFIVNAPFSKREAGAVGDPEYPHRSERRLMIPTGPLFNIQVVRRNGDEPAKDDRVGQFSALNPNQRRFAGLATAPIAAKRTVFFNENPTDPILHGRGKGSRKRYSTRMPLLP